MVSQERTPIQVIRASGRVLSAKPAVRWQNVYLADVKLRQQTMSTKVYPCGQHPTNPALYSHTMAEVGTEKTVRFAV
jgi:hypothetical protein